MVENHVSKCGNCQLFSILYVQDGVLFCKFCCHSLSFKNSTIRDHINSAKHRKLKDKPVVSIQCYYEIVKQYCKQGAIPHFAAFFP